MQESKDRLEEGAEKARYFRNMIAYRDCTSRMYVSHVECRRLASLVNYTG